MREWMLALLICLLAPMIALAADELNGTYLGVDEAEGARIQIAPDAGGYQGTFFDAKGSSQGFQADNVEAGAEAVLDMDNRTVLMRMVALPFGAQVQLIPFGADGALDFGSARVLAFLREGVTLPEQPDHFIPAPSRMGEKVSANAFVESYQFWEPEGVVNGYLGIPERYRTMMRMFAAVQLDVIWKLCLASDGDRALATALRGQEVACPDVVETVSNLQRRGRFDSYKAEVDEQRKALQTSIQCADGYRISKAACDAAARRLADAATSLETAGQVLRKYR